MHQASCEAKMGRSFNSLGDYGSFLTKRSIEAPLAARIGMIACAVNGKRHARELFGKEAKLQPELADSTKTERQRLGFSPDETLLRTGKLRDSVEVSAEFESAGFGSADPIALWQELGTSRIPGRHLFAIAANDSRDENFAIASAAAAKAAGVDSKDVVVELRMSFAGFTDITGRLNELKRLGRA